MFDKCHDLCLRKFFAPNWLNIMDLSLVTIALISGASEHTGTSDMSNLGCALWNWNTLNTNLMIPDFPHIMKISLAPVNFFCCPLMLLSLCSVGCLSLAFQNWDSQQGRDLAMSGRNKQKFQLGQSYSYIMRKVWYHQIWIQNNLGFMVSDLMYTTEYSSTLFDKTISFKCQIFILSGKIDVNFSSNFIWHRTIKIF